jgi:hypothetical protein
MAGLHVIPYWFFNYWFSENWVSLAVSWIPLAMFIVQALVLAFGIASIHSKRTVMLAAPVCLSVVVLALMLYIGETLPYRDSFEEYQLGYYLVFPSLALFLSAFILNEVAKKQQTPDSRLRVDDYKFYRQLFLGFGILLLIIGIALPIFTLTFYSPFGSTYYVNLPYWGDGIAMVIIGIILIVLSQVLHRRHTFRLQEQQTSSLT